MKALIQRVLKSSVTVSDEIVGSIQSGLCVLIGISKNDTDKDMEYLARKILNIKLFESDGQPWKKSVMEKDFEVLCISQFTLYARTSKGAKPDYHDAMPSAQSKEFYEKFLLLLKSMYKEDKIQDGKFGALMKVDIQNDGPVTIMIESNKAESNSALPD